MRLYDPRRYLVREGDINLVEKKKLTLYHAFLFNDSFLIAKKTKGTNMLGTGNRKSLQLKLWIPLHEAVVQEIENASKNRR